MKIKNLLLLWVLFAIAIIIVSNYNFQLMPGKPVILPDSAKGFALFVCPAADAGFEEAARQLGMFKDILFIVFMFLLMLWAAITGWTLYQSLLKDKFEKKSYELPIFLGKFLLFAFMIAMVVLKTPNYFRTIQLAGSDDKWVLCESDTPGARAVKKDAVSVKRSL